MTGCWTDPRELRAQGLQKKKNVIFKMMEFRKVSFEIGKPIFDLLLKLTKMQTKMYV